MKKTLFALVLLLTIFSLANAQEIKRNAFHPENTNKIFNSQTITARINPNFPVFPQDSTNQPPQTSTYIQPDAKTRRNRYLKAAFGVSALANSGASAAFNEVTNSPKEWHRTIGGFGKRLASSYVTGAISKTITYGINEAFKLDDHFEKSKLTGFNKRIKYVLLNSFATHTEKGKYIPDFPHFIGTYAANILAKETWYPKRYDYKDGLTSGTLALLTRLGFHFVKEFILK